MIDRYTLPKMGSIWSEQSKFESWLKVELAVCEVWNELGKIPNKSLQNIKNSASFTLNRINEIEKEVDHDLIAFTTTIAESVGEDSKYIHIGLTSYDVEDTALGLRLKSSAKLIIEAIEKLIEVLKRRAKTHKDSIMMGRTHGVHAEPTTFALKLCVWIAEMERNLERISNAKETVSCGKISGAVGTYAHLDPDIEEKVCKKLGLKASPASTQVLQRDRIAEYMAALAVTAGSLEKFATEIRNLARTEILEVEEPFKKGQKGSSAMPHKKNPIVCERVVSLARIIRSNAQVALENIALWHERDLTNSASERIILPDSSILLDYILHKFTVVMDGLVVYPENMKRNIEKTLGLIFSQRILLKLIEKGLLREDAYKIVQRCAMEAKGKGINLKTILLSDREVLKYLQKQEINDLFDINFFIRNAEVVYKRFNI